MATQLDRDTEMLFFSFYNTRTVDQRQAQRITGDQIAALKQARERADRAASTGTVKLCNFVRNVFDTIGDAMRLPGKKHAMCENYGHTADLASWTEHLPKCLDCGKIIQSRNELRGSSLR